ncbi:MAG: hypothetical protein WC856_06565 [Methylococcaceae bacterium]|jgi:hypothetical protein
MNFKKIEPNLTFADIALFNSRERNRVIKRMKEINATVDWTPSKRSFSGFLIMKK